MLKTISQQQINATGNAPIYAARAWVNFDGTGTVAIRGSGNVSSITDNGTGDYTVNFTIAMQDVNFAAVCSAATSGTGSSTGAYTGDISTAVGSCRLRTFFGLTQYDCFNVGVAIFR
jgi:hypothetical protein